MPKFLGKNDRGRDDRSGQCAASHFVDPPDAGDTNRAQFSLMPESAAPIHHGRILKS